MGKSVLNLVNYDFVAPKDPEASIWRYMDLAKYLSMLYTGSVYFANTLILKEDRFELSWPRRVLEQRQETTRSMFDRLYSSFLLQNPGQEESLPSIDSVVEMDEKYRSWEKNYTFVSCWHLGDVESAAMWKIYGSESKSIVIRSKISSLIDQIRRSPSFAGFGEGLDYLSVGAVQYIDFDEFEDFMYELPYTRAFLKRKNFSHEKEIRVVLGKITGRTFERGIAVRVNLGSLIEEVRIGPGAEPWFIEMVKEATNKFGFDFPVNRTSLDNDPIF